MKNKKKEKRIVKEILNGIKILSLITSYASPILVTIIISLILFKSSFDFRMIILFYIWGFYFSSWLVDKMFLRWVLDKNGKEKKGVNPTW